MKTIFELFTLVLVCWTGLALFIAVKVWEDQGAWLRRNIIESALSLTAFSAAMLYWAGVFPGFQPLSFAIGCVFWGCAGCLLFFLLLGLFFVLHPEIKDIK